LSGFSVRTTLPLALVAASLLACVADDGGPLFPDAGGAGGEGGALGAGGAGGAGGGSAKTCDPAMGATACDACVYATCCDAALACDAGTACDALWSCARASGCFAADVGDFDACAVAACPTEATQDAFDALTSLATCIRTNCGICGG